MDFPAFDPAACGLFLEMAEPAKKSIGRSHGSAALKVYHEPTEMIVRAFYLSHTGGHEA